jgi:hypothetical protein
MRRNAARSQKRLAHSRLSRVRDPGSIGREQSGATAAFRAKAVRGPLHVGIHALEDAIGVSLFERSGRTAMLTRAGESYLLEVRRRSVSSQRRARACSDAHRHGAARPANYGIPQLPPRTQGASRPASKACARPSTGSASRSRPSRGHSLGEERAAGRALADPGRIGFVYREHDQERFPFTSIANWLRAPTGFAPNTTRCQHSPPAASPQPNR